MSASTGDAKTLPRGGVSGARLDAIDLLRGLSILAVVLFHIRLRMDLVGALAEGWMHGQLFDLFFDKGTEGVMVFFAVSGFLITLTSLRRFGSLAAMKPKSFYRIRFARIAPLLFLLLLVLSGLHLVGAEGFHVEGPAHSLPRALLAALTFHLNWLEASRGYLPANWDVLWSLSIEEMFYLFFPLACVLLLRGKRGMYLFVLLLLGLVVLGPFARRVWIANELWTEKSYLIGMEGIAIGCLFALLTHFLQRSGKATRNAKLWRAFGLVGFFLIALIVAWPQWNWTRPAMRLIGHCGIYGIVLEFGTCLVMMGSLLNGRNCGRWSVPLRWFGRHSYEVYLTHEFVVVWGTALYLKLHRGPQVLWFFGILLLAALLGAGVARWFTEPMNQWLRGWSSESMQAS